jgi:protein TonB
MKRMLWASAMAAVLHMAAFQLEMPWARPVVALQPRESMTVSLTAMPLPDPVPIKKDKPIPSPEIKQSAAPKAEKKSSPVKPILQPKDPSEPHRLFQDDFDPVPPPEKEEPSETDEEDEPESQEDEENTDEPPRQTGSPVKALPSLEASTSIQVSTPRHDLNPPPSYPPLALRRGYAGVVLLKVLVGRDGRPLKIEIETSSGYGVLDRDAVEEVSHWRFRPAMRGAAPIEMWVHQPVAYRLK